MPKKAAQSMLLLLSSLLVFHANGFSPASSFVSRGGKSLVSSIHGGSHAAVGFTASPTAFLSTTTKSLTTSTKQRRSLLYASSLKNDDADKNIDCDVLVIGSGPAGRAIASLLSSSSFNVILADKNNLDKPWPPNYGVWKDEWQAIIDAYNSMGVSSLENAIDREWNVTDCYFGGSFDIPIEQRTRLNRPYCRVDKDALRALLTKSNYTTLKANHISSAIGINLYSPTNSLVHDERGTTIVLENDNDEQITVRTKLVVDTTGHETKLVLRKARDKSRSPGFQIAYGVLVKVKEDNNITDSSIGPYDKEAMTLFDYRTDHLDENDESAIKIPTFMYAMPLKDNLIFFEETSLVGRPAISFRLCKDRCFRRLAHHGIEVEEIYEEEFCYIPMGGALPIPDQRVVGLGGAAAMVHPSTGYHLCRCLMGAADMAKSIRKDLKKEEDMNLDIAAANAYHAIWSPENQRQRDFAVFGGEFLMKQTTIGLRGFFDGFFKLPLPLWGGFLAGWPGLPNNEKHHSWSARLWFGLNFVARLPLPVALDMAASIVKYIVSDGGIVLARSVTPLLGEPDSYEYKRNADIMGDVIAKKEAREMIAASQVTDDVPVAFHKVPGEALLEQQQQQQQQLVRNDLEISIPFSFLEKTAEKITETKTTTEESTVAGTKVPEPQVEETETVAEKPKVVEPKAEEAEPTLFDTQPQEVVDEPKSKVAPEIVEPKREAPEPEVVGTKIEEPEPEVVKPKMEEPEPEVAEPKMKEPKPEVVEPKMEAPEPEVAETKMEEPEPEIVEPKMKESKPNAVEPKIKEPEPDAVKPKMEEPEVVEPKMKEPKPDIVETKMEKPKPDVVEPKIKEAEPKVVETKMEKPEPQVVEPKTEVTAVSEPTAKETKSDETVVAMDQQKTEEPEVVELKKSDKPKEVKTKPKEAEPEDELKLKEDATAGPEAVEPEAVEIKSEEDTKLTVEATPAETKPEGTETKIAEAKQEKAESTAVTDTKPVEMKSEKPEPVAVETKSTEPELKPTAAAAEEAESVESKMEEAEAEPPIASRPQKKPKKAGIKPEAAAETKESKVIEAKAKAVDKAAVQVKDEGEKTKPDEKAAKPSQGIVSEGAFE